MNEHTPGPWNNYQGDDIYCVYDQSGKKICTVEPVDIVGWNAVYRAEAEANESLIVAAPELLDALEEMVISFAQFEIYEYQGDALEKARAAIAKAKGATDAAS